MTELNVPYLSFPDQVMFHEKRQLPKEVQKALKAKLKFLYSLIIHYTLLSQLESAVLTARQFLKTVQEEGVLLPDSISSHFCVKCSAFLLPTYTSTARCEIEKKKAMIVVECKVCKKAVQKDVLPSTPLDRAKERMLVEHSSRNSVDGLRLLDVTTPGPKSAAANAPSSSTLLTPYLKATANKHTGQAQPTSKIPSSSNSTQPQKFSFLSSVKSLARPSMLPGKSAAPLMSQVDRRQSAPGNLMNSSMQPSSMMSAVLSGTKRPGEDAPTMPNLLEIERMNKKKKKRLSEGGDS